MLDLLEAVVETLSSAEQSWNLMPLVAWCALYPSILSIGCGCAKISRTLSLCALPLSYRIYPGALNSLPK
jgi:hypothetical protein